MTTKQTLEKRIIDANALVEKLCDRKKHFLSKMGGYQALLQREKGIVDELIRCTDAVINAPTVDAVEVPCLCDECQFSIQDHPRDPMECTKWSSKGRPVYTVPNGYCHKGKKKG